MQAFCRGFLAVCFVIVRGVFEQVFICWLSVFVGWDLLSGGGVLITVLCLRICFCSQTLCWLFLFSSALYAVDLIKRKKYTQMLKY